jgi:hypothetical protein
MINKIAGFSKMGLWHKWQFNNANVEQVLQWSHYLLKLMASSIPGSIATGFLPWGRLKKHVYKNPYTLEDVKQNTELCSGLHQTLEKEQMHVSLNMVDISNT